MCPRSTDADAASRTRMDVEGASHVMRTKERGEGDLLTMHFHLRHRNRRASQLFCTKSVCTAVFSAKTSWVALVCAFCSTANANVALA